MHTDMPLENCTPNIFDVNVCNSTVTHSTIADRLLSASISCVYLSVYLSPLSESQSLHDMCLQRIRSIIHRITRCVGWIRMFKFYYLLFFLNAYDDRLYLHPRDSQFFKDRCMFISILLDIMC